ncbi:MAG: RagB/SusD family nutrient uptake outer membrane protein [Bacteroidetes bacterium]|nr:RagB/SusD family nutrient uptake outer membrane protein [Bacteroidota bacterium]MCL6103743.1 RagB/SusD family nutrient uptake outer membrane protein [Bacteroidota bacterium]
MRYLKIYSLLLILSISFGACKKLLEPENDNHSTIDRIYKDPAFAEGLLMTAYAKIPTNYLSFNDVATDDAVTNNKLNDYLRMATGQWSALYNPVNQWDNCNSAILYLNNFISIIDTVAWKWSNSEINTMFVRRFKGEAYALRGLFEYHLLQTIGGVGADNRLLGIPLYDKFINVSDNFNVPRATFAESVNQIYSDFDKALEYLTMDDYKNITLASQLPPGLEGVNVTNYNSVFGLRANQRISGRIVKAMKARVALLAASPAFNTNNDPALWVKAAGYAGAAITGIGGIAGLDPNGHRFYEAARVDAINLAQNKDQIEMLWRRAIATTNTREQSNFPPSLYGLGYVNPTQNLVDAFPAKNGYPVTNPLSNFNPASPYANRDPRLALYIIYNGNTMSGKAITTGVGGGNNAKDSIQTSTRTGYYLKKLLREDVNMNPVSTSTKKHYEVHMRFTELFLIYAEAANEAYGPDGTGSNGFSARNVIAAIRKRAGISQPDNYLISITTKDDMRKLIRNERRLELCFEGFRFWDLRRWKADLTETAKGININKTNLTVVDVEPRSYNNEYMHSGPLPEREVVKYNALVQNKGW